jgi:hypothetical protein
MDSSFIPAESEAEEAFRDYCCKEAQKRTSKIVQDLKEVLNSDAIEQEDKEAAIAIEHATCWLTLGVLYTRLIRDNEPILEHMLGVLKDYINEAKQNAK